MQTTIRPRLFALAVLVLASNIAAFSQTSQGYMNDLGNTPYGINIPVENGFINVSNGNLHLEFPIISPPQRGALSVSERLVYDSRIWMFLPFGSHGSYHWWPKNVTPAGGTDVSGGWRLIKGSEVGAISYILSDSNNSGTCYNYNEDEELNTTYQVSQIIWTDPSGTAHPLNATNNYSYDPCQQVSSQNIVSGSATDGSGYSASDDGSGNPIVTDNSGNQVYPQVIDRYGNYLSQDGAGNLIDTAGRVPVIATQSGNTTYYDALAPNGTINNQGTRVRYTVTTTPMAVASNFQDWSNSDIHQWCNQCPQQNNLNLFTPVTSIQLPDGSQYTFGYDATGELTSLTLPTGGTISYGYSNIFDSSNTENRWLTSRIVGNNPAMTFTPSVVTACANYSSGCVEQVNLHKPSGDETVYQFNLVNGAWNTGVTAYAGSASSSQPISNISTVNTYINGCTLGGYVCNGETYVSQSTSTTTVYGTQAVTSQTQSVLNPVVGKPSAVKEWDFVPAGQGFHSNPYRETDYTYVGDDLQRTTVLDQSGQQVSQTTYSYTSTAAASYSSTWHGTANAGGPYLQKVSQWLDADGSTLDQTLTYDDAGTLLSSTDPNGTTAYGHDSSHIFVTSVTPPISSSGVSLTSTATYDLNSGVILTQTDPNGATTHYSGYDALSRPTEVDVNDSNSNLVAKTTYSYSTNQSGVHRYLTPSVSGDTETLYDAFGRPIRTAVYNGQSSNPWYQRDVCYDSSGRPNFQSTSYQGNGWSTAQVCSGNNAGSTTTYDALGRPLSVVNADGTAHFTYAGRAVQKIDVNGVQTITQTDAFGRLLTVCEISSNSLAGELPAACGTDIAGTGYVTSYSYDLAQHLTTINQGAQRRSFQTDPVGRTISVTEPERGTTSYIYTYNSSLGLKVVRTRPHANQGNTATLTHTTTQYDSLGRVVNVTYDDNQTPQKNFYYDQSYNLGFTSAASNNVKGRLAAIFGGYSTPMQTSDQFSYDSAGNVTTMWQCAPSICNTNNQTSRPALQFSYDLAGNLTYEYDGAAGGISYGRSPAGEITSITNQTYTDAGNTPNLISNVINSPFGPTGYTLGNGLSVGMSYDSLGRENSSNLCTGPAQTNCGNSLQGWAAVFSGSRVVGSCDPVEDSQYCYGHSYDEFNRHISSSTGHGTAYTYAYDRYGNRTQETSSPSGPNPSFSFNSANNRMTGISYDAAGNVTGDGFHSYTYDAEGNVLTADGASYVYDAMNHRVASSNGTANVGYGTAAEFLYDPFGHRTSTWITSINFGNEGRIYWGDQQIAYRAFNGQTYFEHQNWLGTERMRTNYQGQIAKTSVSLAFGDGFAQSSTDPYGPAQDNNEFAGLDHDSESNTDHAQFRQYSPTQGRWMSPDPYDGSMDLGNPQSLNRYTYALNNPLRFTDPSGLCSTTQSVTISASGGESDYATSALACSFWDAIEAFAGAIGTGFADFGHDIASLFGFGHPAFKGSLKPRPSANPGFGDHYMAAQVFQGPGSGSFVAANTAVRYGAYGYSTAVVAAPFAAEGAVALGYEGLASAGLSETSVVPQQLILGDHVMVGGDAFHLGARIMAGEVVQNGFPIMTGLSGAGFSTPYLLYGLPGEINGVAGTFTVGGHILAGGACYITHACFFPY